MTEIAGDRSRIACTFNAIDATVSKPKKVRVGHPDIFRVNVNGAKFVFSVSGPGELAKWMTALKARDQDIDANLVAVPAGWRFNQLRNKTAPANEMVDGIWDDVGHAQKLGKLQRVKDGFSKSRADLRSSMQLPGTTYLPWLGNDGDGNDADSQQELDDAGPSIDDTMAAHKINVAKPPPKFVSALKENARKLSESMADCVIEPNSNATVAQCTQWLRRNRMTLSAMMQPGTMANSAIQNTATAVLNDLLSAVQKACLQIEDNMFCLSVVQSTTNFVDLLYCYYGAGKQKPSDLAEWRTAIERWTAMVETTKQQVQKLKGVPTNEVMVQLTVAAEGISLLTKATGEAVKAGSKLLLSVSVISSRLVRAFLLLWVTSCSRESITCRAGNL